MASLYEMARGDDFDPLGAFMAGRQAKFDAKMNQNKLAELARMEQARPLFGQAVMGDQNALAGLAQLDPASALDVQKANVEQGKANREAQQKEYERIAGVLQAADTPQKWDQAIRFLESQGADITPEERNFANRDFVIAQGAKEAAKLGLTPIWGTDANGNPAVAQMGENGVPKVVNFGPGFTPSKGVQFIDQGNQYAPVDKLTGTAVPGAPPVPVNNAQVEMDKKLGEAQAKMVSAAPNIISNGEETLNLLDKLRTSEALQSSTGFSSIANAVPGTPGYDFKNILEQVKSGAFLSAIPNLQGMGALSNTEGATATAAITRMDAATSTGAFMDALEDYERVVSRTMARARRILANRPTYPGADGITPADQGGTFNNDGYTIEEVQ